MFATDPHVWRNHFTQEGEEGGGRRAMNAYDERTRDIQVKTHSLRFVICHSPAVTPRYYRVRSEAAAPWSFLVARSSAVVPGPASNTRLCAVMAMLGSAPAARSSLIHSQWFSKAAHMSAVMFPTCEEMFVRRKGRGKG